MDEPRLNGELHPIKVLNFFITLMIIILNGVSLQENVPGVDGVSNGMQ